MDGNNIIVLANLSNVGSTYIDVALDKTGNRLFFSDKTNNVIRYIDLRNMGILTLLSGNLHRPTSLTMLNNTLYWTAEGNGRFTGAIFKAEATSASKGQMIADGFSYPKGIYVHSYLGTQIPGNCFKDTSDLDIYIIFITFWLFRKFNAKYAYPIRLKSRQFGKYPENDRFFFSGMPTRKKNIRVQPMTF